MEDAREQLKEGAIEADWIYRYYAGLAGKYSKYNQRFMFAIAISSVLAIAATVANVDEWWATALTVLLAGAAASLATAIPLVDYSRRAGVAASIAGSCMDLTDDWEMLWRKSKNMTEDDILRESEPLMRRLTRATAPALLQHGFDDVKRNTKSLTDAQENWELTHAR